MPNGLPQISVPELRFCVVPFVIVDSRLAMMPCHSRLDQCDFDEIEKQASKDRTLS